MNRFTKRPLSLPAILLFTVLFAGLASCTKVDDTLGLELIPDDQKMQMKVSLLGGAQGAASIQTSVTLPDSISTSNLGTAIIGKYESALFGKTAAVSLLSFLPGDEVQFGEKATPDSLLLRTKPQFLSGDKSKTCTFNIYPMRDTIAYDTTLYQFVDYERLLEVAPQPLFSFSLTGEYTEITDIKLEPTAAGQQFLEELVADTLIYDDMNKFRELFKGWAIAPANGFPDDGAIYSFSLSADNSILTYCFHNYESATSNTRKDTVYLNFSMDDADYYTYSGYQYEYTYKNRSAVSLRHDYAGTPVGNAIDAGDVRSQVFIHGYAGATTQLEFPREFMKEIADLCPADKDMLIHQAQIYLWLDDDTTEAFDLAATRLGSYYSYFNKDSAYAPGRGSVYVNIPDYSLYDEANSQYYPYGGTLNRTHGYYSMDITTFLHYALKEYRTMDAADYTAQATRNKYTLAPELWYLSTGFRADVSKGETVLQGTGSADKPVELKLTYTLINK